jgi:hypothetical protein
VYEHRLGGQCVERRLVDQPLRRVGQRTGENEILRPSERVAGVVEPENVVGRTALLRRVADTNRLDVERRQAVDNCLPDGTQADHCDGAAS